MADYSKQIVYLSQAQYEELILHGTITVNDVTITYNENDIYVTPQDAPVTDVRINGTSIAANGVANIPVASPSILGVVKSDADYGTDITNQRIRIVKAADDQVKQGVHGARPIAPGSQHLSVFYGLAKVAGHDEKDSAEPLGTYTPGAKGAIQKMLGVSDLIATEENNLIASKAYAVGDVFTANGKLYKATAAIAVDGAIIVDGENANCVETNVGERFPHDVQVNGTSIISNGVANVPVAQANVLGVVKAPGTYGVSVFGGGSAGTLALNPASAAQIKAGNSTFNPISPVNVAPTAFYGLAKVAGADEKDSTLPVGQYTDTAKTAIRSMIGATSSNVIAVQDTQPTDTDTKIWLPETAETPVEVPTMEDLGDYVQKTDYATTDEYGLVKVGSGLYIGGSTGKLSVGYANSSSIKNATNANASAPVSLQHESVFYGLAKAAGDTTQSASDNAVGTYTDDAKSAIRTMLGVIGDVQVNGTSVVSNGIATVPIAVQTNSLGEGQYGLVKINSSNGITIAGDGCLSVNRASETQYKNGGNNYLMVTPFGQHMAVFYGLAKAAGDTTQSVSSNAVGTYTDDAKLAIQTMLGIDLSSIASQVEIPLVETVDGAAVTITGQPNTRYMCGEVTSISITPPAAGSIDVIFTSGSTVAVLTLPSTVKMPEWFDATTLETDTIYEILITDGTYGSVMTWAV